jgi:hypothetical protein
LGKLCVHNDFSFGRYSVGGETLQDAPGIARAAGETGQPGMGPGWSLVGTI